MENRKKYQWTLIEASLFIIGCFMVSGALVYKILSLDWLGLVVVMMIMGLIGWFVVSRVEIQKTSFNWLCLARTNYPLLALMILNIFAWIMLYNSRSYEAIISPWQQLGVWWFLLYALIIGLTLFCLSRPGISWLIALITSVSVGNLVALLVYGIGFGFDPFVHQATENYIKEFGSVDPKPLYYASQYALVVFLSKIFFIPVIWLDKILVPVFSAIILPLMIANSFGHIFKNTSSWRLVAGVIMFLSTSLFLVTTPQNIAYLLLFCLILLLMKAKETNWHLAYILALATMTTQPIAGIPAMLGVIAWHLYYSQVPYRKIFITASLFLTALVLPLTFFLLDFSYNQKINLVFQNFDWSWLIIKFPNNHSIWLNYSYWWQSVIPAFFLLLIIIGLIYNWKIKQERRNNYWLFWWQGVALVIAYLLTKNVAFSFLINYERDNYANRILICAVIFWLPFISIGLYETIKLILHSEKYLRYIWLLIGISILTANIYISYPRYDNYFDSHSYATSKHDIQAVQRIKAMAGESDFIVLANQQVSAASLREYGFKKYYHGDIFYYPIPTGGPLYQLYLEISSQPSLDTIEKARQLTNVHQVFVVINDYWWQSKRLIPELEIISQEHEVIGSKVHIFRFNY